MKTNNIKLGILKIFLILIILLSSISLVSAIPNSITLQGKLADSSGNALYGTYNMSFRIYDAYTGGSALWSLEDINITTDSDGIYEVMFKDVNLGFADQYYLGITVGTDAESAPRINLSSSPYAFRANVSEGLNENNEYTVAVFNITGNLSIGTTGDDYLTITTKMFNVTGGGSISLAGNISVAQKIILGLGEYIDNLIDGIIKITGDLNVTGTVWSQGINLTALSSGTGGWTDSGDSVRLITAGDKVGIGIDAPSEKLSVDGNTSITGDLILGGDLIGNGGSGSGSANAFGWVKSGTKVFLAVTTDLVGIGVTSPNSTLTVAGNITPSKNNTYTLGEEDLVWKDIYVGSSSLHIGGKTLSNDGGSLRWGNNEISTEGSPLNITSLNASGDLNIGGGDLIVNATSGDVGIGRRNTGIAQLLIKSNLLGKDILYGLNSQDYSVFEVHTSTGDDGWIAINNASGSRKVQIASDTWSYFNGGFVGIGTGTTAPEYLLDVQGDIEVGTGTTGCVYDEDGTIIAGTCSSDIRLKKDIKPLTNVLDYVSMLQPVTFRWKNSKISNKTELGLIAQEVQKVLPELVETDDKGYLRVGYDSRLMMFMIESIKELKQEKDFEIEYLKQQNNAKQAQIEQLTNIVCLDHPEEDICK